MANVITIIGRITGQQSGAGIAALKVEAWGRVRNPGPPGQRPGLPTRAKRLASTNTNAEGRFRFEFERGLPVGLRGEVYFKVFDTDGAFLRDTSDSIVWDPDSPADVVIPVEMRDLPPPPPPPPWPGQAVVYGTVHHQNGVAVANLVIRLYDKRIGREQELGSDNSDTEGAFRILYSDQLQTPDLFVRVYPQANTPHADTPLVVSAIRYNATQEEYFELIIDVPAYRGPSEFDRVEQALAPYLQNVELEDLDAEDIALLAGKTQHSHEHVSRYVAAGIMAKQSDDLSSESLYALLRSGYVPPLDQVLAHDGDALESTLQQAAESNIVSLQMGDQASSTVAKMQDLRRQRIAGVSPGSLGELLVLAGLDEAQRDAVADLIIQHKRGEDLWQKLRDTGFDPDTVDAVQLSIELGQITAGHTPLVQAVLQQAPPPIPTPGPGPGGPGNTPPISTPGVPGGGGPGTHPLLPVPPPPNRLSDIAWYTEEQWNKQFDQQIDGQPVGVPDFIAGETPADQRSNYVQFLFAMLEAAVPTAAIGAAMLRSGTRPPIRSFLRGYPDFEFTSSHIATFLEQNNVPAQVQDVLIPELKELQRVYRIAPVHERYRVMDTLLNQGYHSAQDVARQSQSAFVRQMQINLDKQQAISVYRKARLYSSLALTAYMSDVQGSLEPNIRMLPPWQAPWGNQGGASVPVNNTMANDDDAARMADYRSLFDSIDFCACEHCRSVLSPAAYFVDLLHWLGQQEKNVEDKTPLDVLLDRRPDLNTLALSCENTDTLVSYVDLVNEILENAVARHYDVSVISHDTSLPHSDELLATPQYLNPAAYNGLTLAVYPARLPFHLWLIQARVFLKQLGVERWQLMQAFARTDNPTDLEIATESLEMSTQERELILNATPDPQLWGYSTNDGWIGELATVTTFLQRAGFEEGGERFERLLDILNTETANPGEQIYLLPEPETGGPVGGGSGTTPPIGGGPGTTPPGGMPPSGDPAAQPPQPDICDLNQLTIKKTSGDPQDTDYHHMQRFLRLWRRVDWTMLELDKVLIALNKTNNIDDAVIKSIADIHYIQKQTNMDLLPLLSWWADIDTKTDRNSKAATQQVRSLFEEVFLNPALGRAVTDKFRSVISGPPPPPPIPTPGPGPGGPGTTPPISTPGVPGGGGPGTQPPEPVPPLPGPINLIDLEAELQAALGITDEELNHIKAAMFVDTNGDDIWDDAELNLANLSALYRVVALSQTLKLEVRQALALRALTVTAAEPLDPFTNTAQARKFIEEVNEICEAGFSVTELLYLLGHDHEAVLQLTPSMEQMALVLSDLRMGLRDIRNELTLQPDVTGELTRALLFEAGVSEHDDAEKPQDVLDEFMRLIFGRSTLSDVDKEDLITFVNNSVSSPDQFLNVPDAIQQLVLNAIPLDETEKRIKYVQTAVSSYLEHYRSERIVNQTLATEYNLEVRIATDLLMQRLAAMPVFLSDDFINGKLASGISSVGEDAGVDLDLNPVDQAAAFTLLMKLHKSSALLLKLKVDVDAYTWLLEHGIGWGLIDPLNLPLQAQSPAVLYRPWKKLADFFRLHDTLPGVRPTLAELLKLFLRYEERWTAALDAMSGLPLGIDAANFPVLLVEAMTAFLDELTQKYPQAQQADLQSVKDHAQKTQTLQNAFLQGLYDRTGWEQTDFEYLSTAFDYATPSRFHDPDTWYELIDRFDIIRHIARPAREIDPWRVAELSQAEADEIRMALKAHYGYEQWLNVAKQLQDPLREQQRAALVTYLIANENSIENSRDLYGRYLIDVEMSSCAKTSRIKQAISSVQLFVQRCFLGFEEGDQGDGATLDADAHREWKWHAHYRIWEANRKVFLYPENWIYPELRRDKSPFFEELESELLQNEINEKTVESAYLNYLEKLNEVARLEVSALYHQKEDDEGGNTDIVHVFGRTPSLPHSYYYRQLIGGDRWTAWERVELDIEGEHLLPVVHNRRLLLFWPIFLEQREKDEEDGVQWLDVQLAWSECRDNRWSSKRVSEGVISSNQLTSYWHLSRRLYEFTVVKVDQNLQIDFLSRADGLRFGSFIYNDCNGNLRLSTQTQSIAPQWSSDIHEITYNFLNVRNTLRLTATSPWSQTTLLIDVLDRCSENTRIKYARQYDGVDYANYQGWRFRSQEPFFVEDPYRTFYTIPSIVPLMSQENPGGYSYGDLAEVLQKYVTDTNFHQEYQTSGTAFENMLSDSRVGDGKLVRGGATKLDIGGTHFIKDSGLLPILLGGEKQREVLPLHVDPRFRLRQTQAYLQAVVAGGDVILNRPFDANYRFAVFYHPFVCRFITQVRRHGIGGLLDPKDDDVEADLSRQRLQNSNFFDTNDPIAEFSNYEPTANVLGPFPFEDINFESDSTYSIYNWELFFHAPLFIAVRLSQDQRFEDAMRWFHYIFDPMNRSIPADLAANRYARYWKVRPFTREPEPPIQQLMRDNEERQRLVGQIKAWEEQPFDPHLIAQFRPAAYQKAIVIKYLDNLIAWADQLFRQDSIEAINEATQLYILAAEVLGPRTVKIPALATPNIMNFDGLHNANQGEGLDAFSNFLVEVENLLAPELGEATGIEAAPLSDLGPALYFCIPQNSYLVEYWNTIEDRLFKTRHCMNIEGITRELPLFQPPIDPALLVRAAAAGVDLSSVLGDLNAPLPRYRFNVILDKGKALNATVRALGSALLSALEKRDAEELAQLRSSHEQNLLRAVKEVRNRQIEEAEESVEGLRRTKDVVLVRQAYYQRLFSNGLNAGEEEHLSKLETALRYQWIVQAIEALGALGGSLPQITYTPPAGPTEVEWGGLQFSNVMSATARGLSIGTIVNTHYANRASIRAGHRRRDDEWAHQLDVAGKELEQMDKQILAGDIRLAIAEKEKENHELQLENADVIDTWMRDKFTNQQLYDWIVTQLATLYFQSYQLAYDIAKRAEKCYQHELARPGDAFIQYGHWDSLKKGLLAGERLQYDLERLEVAYLDNDKREYELTKHVSLVTLNPLALLKLHQEGACEFELPEALFDLDQPGHYLRRIKSVSLSIPAVTGPYIGVDGMLTLQSTSVRRVPNLNDDLELENGIAESVAISAGQNDSGLFELSHNDPRYLPFERRGVISHWRLSLSSALAEFDRQTISDVILHLRYTAREGGDAYRETVVSGIEAALNNMDVHDTIGLLQAFSVRHQFPNAWHDFLNPPADADGQKLQLPIGVDRFPYFIQSKNVLVNKVDLLLVLTDPTEFSGLTFEFDMGAYQLQPHQNGDVEPCFKTNDDYANQPYVQLEPPGNGEPPSTVSVVVPEIAEQGGVNLNRGISDLPNEYIIDRDGHKRINPDAIENIMVIMHYSIA